MRFRIAGRTGPRSDAIAQRSVAAAALGVDDIRSHRRYQDKNLVSPARDGARTGTRLASPQPVSTAADSSSIIAGSAVNGPGPSVTLTARDPSTSALTRPGWVAANIAAMPAPSPQARIAARADPAASMTAAMSSARCSSVGTPVTRSESPVLRLSNSSSRPMPARRSRNRANSGSSHIISRCDTQPGTNTRSSPPAVPAT